jgi:hypothetical protein
MTTRQLVVTLLLAALAEATLLGIGVFIGEPQHAGRPRHLHVHDLVYFAIPALLAAGAAFVPARALLGRRTA